jgi:hypothetical protein
MLLSLVGMGMAADLGLFRKPRSGEFLITTEMVTTTITTNSFCYMTEKKLLKKTKECSKKRAIDISQIRGLDQAEVQRILPSVTNPKGPAPEESPIIWNHARGARFLYPVTKTETSTMYDITATTTVVFKCTPASSILNLCEGGDDGGFFDKFDKDKEDDDTDPAGSK